MHTAVPPKLSAVREFSGRVAYARQVRGFTGKTVGQRCAVKQGHVSRLERGHLDPKLPTLHALAVGLDVTPWWLAGSGDVVVPPFAPIGFEALGHYALAAAFGRRLRRARLDRGLSQQNVADLMRSLDRRTIASYECAEKCPHLSSVHLIAAALDVSAGWLIGEDEWDG